jgi:hypothetical protein
MRGKSSAAGVFILFGLLLLVIGGIPYCNNYVSYSKGLGGHITNASVANTVEIATAEMEKVVSYARENGLTSGHTSVFYNTPDEDIGFWFKNMEASLHELKSLPESSSQLERSNTLLKLHETLKYVPEGLANFPHNVILGWILSAGISLFFLGAMALPGKRR